MGVLQCKKCGGDISENDYFCPHCGFKIKSAPLNTSITSQLKAYLVSIFFPPLGLWYAYRYFKNNDAKSKNIALVIVILNILFFIITVWVTGTVFEYLNNQIQTQLQGLESTVSF
jgi:uncharacterized membrane protein YvbJ